MKRFFLLAAVAFCGCRPAEPVPKPRGYARIELPDRHTYQLFERAGFPYVFEYPTYGTIVQDSSRLRERPDNPYWVNVDFPSLDASLYLSYNRINGREALAALLEDAHFMSYYHSKRADFVKDRGYRNAYGVTGLAYEWGGAAASTYQFIATDSTENFLRGALYFNVTPNADSLRPAAEFLKADVEHLMQTLRFRRGA